jgi:protoheme IX farnesyltransferase
LWTPPHFWALAMKFRKDYAAANVPMLPVVATPAVVARKILWYSYAMVAATLVLIPFAGWIYGVLAGALGAWFLAGAHGLDTRVRAAPEFSPEMSPGMNPEMSPGMNRATESAASCVDRAPSPAPMRLFHLSIAYLTLLFAAVAITALLPWGRW